MKGLIGVAHEGQGNFQTLGHFPTVVPECLPLSLFRGADHFSPISPQQLFPLFWSEQEKRSAF